MHMYLKKIDCKGLQIEAFHQRSAKCWFETPYLEGKLVPKTCKNRKISFKQKFLSGLVTKLEKLFVFGKTLWKISSNWWFKKKMLTDLTSARIFKVCFIGWIQKQWSPFARAWSLSTRVQNSSTQVWGHSAPAWSRSTQVMS